MISTRQFFYFAFTYRYFFIKESGRRCWKPMCWRPKAKAQTFKRASRDQTNRGWFSFAWAGKSQYHSAV